MTGRTLHLDQAALTGWALFDGGRCVDQGRVRARGATPEARAAHLAAFVRGLAAYSGPFDLVTLEDVHQVRFQQRRGNPAVVLARLLGALVVALQAAGLQVRVQSIEEAGQVFRLRTKAARLAAAQQCCPELAPWTEDAADAWLHGRFYAATGGG